MARAFAQLRGLMAARDYDNYRLGLALDLSASSISERLCGKMAWRLTEMYKVMNLFGIEHDRLNEIFPENGGLVPLRTIKKKG